MAFERPGGSPEIRHAQLFVPIQPVIVEGRGVNATLRLRPWQPRSEELLQHRNGELLPIPAGRNLPSGGAGTDNMSLTLLWDRRT
jgi:hypothetical protein